MRARQKVALSIGVVLLFVLAAVATFAQGVTAAGVPKKQMPDLTVNDIWWYPGDPIAGESTTIYVTIKNIGTKDIRHETFYTQLKVDGTQVMISSIEDLNAGSIHTFTKAVTLASGTHSLWAYVDYYDLIDEKYETNNYREEYVTAIALPDLAAVDIWTEPSPPIGDQSTYIRLQISVNDVPFTETVWTRLYIDGVLKAGFGMSGSTGAQVKTYTYTTTQLGSGNHELRMVTDADNVLTESSETNNERTETIYWEPPSLPNVRTGSYSFDPTPLTEAVPTTIYFTIYTNEVPFTQTVYTYLYIDDVLKTTKALSGSTGSATYTYSYTTALTAGTHWIKMVTDATGVLVESSETDNTYNVGYTWQPSSLPDVATVDIWTDPDPPTGGQTATVYFSISTSSVPFTQTIYTRLYIDGVLKVTKYLYGSSGSATHTYSYSTTQSTGDHVIRVVTDATGVLTESWETNNERIETITWQALPDVAAVNIWTSPSPPKAGQSATIYFSISTNSVPFTQTIYTRLYIDGVYKTTKYLYGSSGSGTHTYSYSTTQSAGDHVVKIITDATGVLTESSETNNERTETYTWVDPDSDGDGLTDSYEISIGTDPYDPDTDDDGWNDGDEVNKYYTDPTKSDTDSDGVIDSSDVDPLVNVMVSVWIFEVWSVDPIDSQVSDFYCTVSISGQSSSSPVIMDSEHIYPNWLFQVDVSDALTSVSVVITLWDENGATDQICDISRDAGGGDEGQPSGSNAEMTYDMNTGSWNGDDYLGDASGYGRLSGNDDGSYSLDQDDCDLWFKIFQSEYDVDGMVYKEEVLTFLTNPKVIDGALDRDDDGIPLDWEQMYGFSDSNAADSQTDTDLDGLTALEEYLNRHYDAKPDHPDLLIEIDYGANHPPHQWMMDYVTKYYATHLTPQGYVGIHLVFDVDDVLSTDDIDPDGNGWTSVWDPIMPIANELQMIVDDHFDDTTRGGAWRYCVFVYKTCYYDPWYGWEEDDDTMACTLVAAPRYMMICDGAIDHWVSWIWWPTITEERAQTTAFMHELGHNLDIIEWTAGGDEDYCDDEQCCMATINVENVEGVIRYCDTHWALLDLVVGFTEDLEPP